MVLQAFADAFKRLKLEVPQSIRGHFLVAAQYGPQKFSGCRWNGCDRAIFDAAQEAMGKLAAHQASSMHKRVPLMSEEQRWECEVLVALGYAHWKAESINRGSGRISVSAKVPVTSQPQGEFVPWHVPSQRHPSFSRGR